MEEGCGGARLGSGRYSCLMSDVGVHCRRFESRTEENLVWSMFPRQKKDLGHAMSKILPSDVDGWEKIPEDCARPSNCS